MQSQCWKMPVIDRRPRWLRCGGQATSIATTCSSPIRDSAVMSNVWGKK
jgi:hypothetical protein